MDEHVVAPLELAELLPTLAEINAFIAEESAGGSEAKLRVYTFAHGESVKNIADLILAGGSEYDEEGLYIRKRLIASLVVETGMVGIKLTRTGKSSHKLRIRWYSSINHRVYIVYK